MRLFLDKYPDGEVKKDPYGMPLYESTPVKKIVVPEGRKMGALPPARGESVTEFGELFVDKFRRDIYDYNKWPELIDAGRGNHIPFRDPITLDQRGIGSCAAEGLVNCVVTQRARRNHNYIRFNPWPLYWYSSGGSDRGSSLSANIREAKARGLVPWDLWPRDQHRWNDLPPQEVWNVAKKYKPGEVWPLGNIREGGTAMFFNHAVYAAYPGHAWELIKILNTKQAIWLNSWGASWGDNGMAVINLSELQFGYGLWAIQSTSYES